MSRPWFLSQRITLAFGLTTFLLSTALSLPFGWILHRAIQEEIAALANEELEEARAFFTDRTPSAAEFARQARDMSADHPETPLALRIWDDAGETWSEFGPRELLELAPRERPPESAPVQQGSVRLATGELHDGWVAAVVLDATVMRGRFRSFWLTALGFVLLATSVATLAGGILALRVSRLIAGVAECARTEASHEAWPPTSAAPEEIRAVVRALQDTLRRIRDESENARLLVSGLAHELRSPLQNLIGETQVALLREREPGEYRRVLESQLEELGELSGVVENLVALSSLDESRRRHTVEHFALAEEARLRLAREAQLARRRGVELRFSAGGPLELEGDRESLLLALRNVVTNAIEWSPPGQTVEVSMSERGEDLEILVDDAGPGVPPAERERIFRPFHRGPAARGRRAGYGLGLALTQSAVRAQGGSIEVLDSPRGGARFRIVLPARVGAGEDGLRNGAARVSAPPAGPAAPLPRA